MPTLLESHPVPPHVLPVDCITPDWLERHPHLFGFTLISALLFLLFTFNEPTPVLTDRLLQPREPRGSALAFVAQPYHEAADATGPPGGVAPVVMIRVVATGPVSLRPESLYENVRAPALEDAGPFFYALDRRITGYLCLFRKAHCRIKAFDAGRPDGAGREMRLTTSTC